MQTKTAIVAALELAIADHKVTADHCVDWDFVDALRDAIAIVQAAPEHTVPAV